MPLFALVAPVVLTRHAAPAIDDLQKKLKWKSKALSTSPRWQGVLNIGILLILILAVVARGFVIFPQPANEADYKDDAPVAAVKYITENKPVGRLFNSYNWGGYLIWNLRDYPVFVDGRTDLYSDDLLTEWLNTMGAGKGWQDTLEKWDIGLVLIEPEWALAKLLPTAGWQLLYEDQSSVLFQRPQ
jgi:hypothetical protein